MPKIADVVARIPEEEHKEYFDGGDFVPVKDWFEQYSKTAKLHFWEDARGYRRVAIVKLSGELRTGQGPRAN